MVTNPMARAKKNNIKLTDDDVKRLKAMLKRKSANQIRSSRCRILLCLDEEHLSAMTYDQCILSHNVSQTTIANTAKRFVPSGIDEVLKINKNIESDKARREVDGRTEARIIDIACGPAPEERSRWALRLLEGQAKIELDEPVNREPIRCSLKKWKMNPYYGRQEK